jgi:hypothetical protein
VPLMANMPVSVPMPRPHMSVFGPMRNVTLFIAISIAIARALAMTRFGFCECGQTQKGHRHYQELFHCMFHRMPPLAKSLLVTLAETLAQRA